MPPQPSSQFLSLPRELRDLIYYYYVYEPEGYHYDFVSGKFHTSRSQTVDLALMYTCRSVAAEMRHLALNINTVVFSTWYSDAERAMAGRFHALLDYDNYTKFLLLGVLSRRAFRKYLSLEVLARVSLKYPQFARGLYQIKGEKWVTFTYSMPRTIGEAGSVRRGFTDCLLGALAEGTDFTEVLRNKTPELKFNSIENACDLFRSKLFLSSIDPWEIPSEQRITELAEYLMYNSWRVKKIMTKRFKYRYSAAALAIRFFKNISYDSRICCRNVLLHEDRVSVAHPECHALGLIPFCRENPQLRIERRVNLWRAILPVSDGIDSSYQMHFAGRARSYDRRLSRFGLSSSIGLWISEAHALCDAGMPPDCFSLTIDGNPDPKTSSKLFEYLKTDFAWQQASDEWMTNNLSRPRFLDLDQSRIVDKAFDSVLPDMIGGNLFIRCNFPVGILHDSKAILDRYRSLFTVENWRWIHYDVIEDKESGNDAFWENPSPFLPSWHELKREDLLEGEAEMSEAGDTETDVSEG